MRKGTEEGERARAGPGAPGLQGGAVVSVKTCREVANLGDPKAQRKFNCGDSPASFRLIRMQ